MFLSIFTKYKDTPFLRVEVITPDSTVVFHDIHDHDSVEVVLDTTARGDIVSVPHGRAWHTENTTTYV